MGFFQKISPRCVELVDGALNSQDDIVPETIRQLKLVIEEESKELDIDPISKLQICTGFWEMAGVQNLGYLSQLMENAKNSKDMDPLVLAKLSFLPIYSSLFRILSAMADERYLSYIALAGFRDTFRSQLGQLSNETFAEEFIKEQVCFSNPIWACLSQGLSLDIKSLSASLNDQGYAIVDNVFGEHSSQLPASLKEDLTSKLEPGKLDETNEFNATVRDDRICWINESTSGTSGAVSEFMRQHLVTSLKAEIPSLLCTSRYRTNLMVSVYPSGSGGYSKHLDNDPLSSRPDKRVLSLVYYLNGDWKEGHGGELVLHTKEGNVQVEPKLDRLVAFWSKEMEHKVLATSADAPDRLAISYWAIE